MLRGPEGIGKSCALAEWARHSDSGPVAWMALDPASGRRDRFWQHLALAIRLADVRAGRHLADVLTALGTTSPGSVGAVVQLLDALDTELTLAMDDFHHVEDDLATELLWILERSERLRFVATTRRSRLLDHPQVAARLHPVVVGVDELALSLDETRALVSASREDEPLLADELHRVTGGHALATRIGLHAAHRARDDASLRDLIAATISEHFLPDLDDASLRLAARLALAPSVDDGLAIELLQGEAASFMDSLEREGWGCFDSSGPGRRFALHAPVAAALTLRAELVDKAERERCRLAIARDLEASGDVHGSVVQLAAAARHDLIWPTVMRRSWAIRPRDHARLERTLMALSPRVVQEQPELAVLLAVIRSARERSPSARTASIVGHAIGPLTARSATEPPIPRMHALAAVLAGHRSLRRYEEATATASRILSLLGELSPTERADAVESVETVLVQIMSTSVADGRFTDALATSAHIGVDPFHPRTPYVVALARLARAMRGELAGPRGAAADEPALFGARVAHAIERVEAGDPVAALERLDGLDGLDEELLGEESWPCALWARGFARLHADESALGADEVLRRLHAFRRVPTSPRARSLVLAIASDLLLASGEPGRAARVLADAPQSHPLVAVAAARQALPGDRPAEARALVDSVLSDASVGPRLHAEALLLEAAIDIRSGLPREAKRSAGRAIAVLEAHALRTPLASIPRAELREALVGVDSSWVDLVDGAADPFGPTLTRHTLTPREIEVLATLATSPSVDALAARLYVSSNTVKTQLRSIYRKLGVSSRESAVRAARLRGLIRS